MNLPGLIQLLSVKRRAAVQAAAIARDPDTKPVTGHESALRADELAREGDAIAEHLQGNLQSIEGIEHLIHYLKKSPHRSADRTLAIRDLEAASMRLRRENGDPEPAPAVQPTNGAAVHA